MAVPAAVLDDATLEQLARLNERFRPEALAKERVLPVIPAFAELLPGGGLQRGWTVGVCGAGCVTSASALAAQASQAGGWTAIVGLPGLNVAALGDVGVALERTMFVNHPPPARWADAVLAAAEGADVVLAAVGSAGVGGADARRLQARLSSRGTVLVLVMADHRPAAQHPPPGRGAERLSADVVIRGDGAVWDGIGHGHGRLLARRVTVEVGGRRLPRAVRRELWLPAADGRVKLVEREPLRRADRAS